MKLRHLRTLHTAVRFRQARLPPRGALQRFPMFMMIAAGSSSTTQAGEEVAEDLIGDASPTPLPSHVDIFFFQKYHFSYQRNANRV